MRRKKGYFSISAVAKMFSVHQQTIRMYEKEGLISPKRSEGNTRMFTEEDIDRLEEVIYLTHKLGINLSGVEMILKLQKRISKLQNEVNKLFQQTHDQLDEDSTDYKKEIREQVKEITSMKRKKAIKVDLEEETSLTKEERSESSDIVEVDDWEIDYEE